MKILHGDANCRSRSRSQSGAEIIPPANRDIGLDGVRQVHSESAASMTPTTTAAASSAHRYSDTSILVFCGFQSGYYSCLCGDPSRLTAVTTAKHQRLLLFHDDHQSPLERTLSCLHLLLLLLLLHCPHQYVLVLLKQTCILCHVPESRQRFHSTQKKK